MPTDERRANDELQKLRRTRQGRVERMLHDEMLRQAPGNAAYWIAVVAGAFLVNLIVLLIVAR